MSDQPPERVFLGIDVGTGGVRALGVGGDGRVVAGTSVPFDAAVLKPQRDRHEQPPEAWWGAVCRATSQLVALLAGAGIDGRQLAAVAVDGTSGTVVALDANGSALRPALMYNDPRPVAEARRLNQAAPDFCRKLGYRFQPSFALAKIAWLAENEPEVFRRTAHFVHQADYVSARLTGRTPVSDFSNALKTGYDLVDECWPEWIDALLDLGDRLPEVVPPGTRIGTVSHTAATETGLPQGLPVVSGATDGTAAFLASGAREVGDYNTTLGTTLVFKGISRHVCRHPQGLVYCHKLPGGRWLPGAASNTGGEWIAGWFPDADAAAMDAAAAGSLPVDCVAYPLVRRGERFPFLSDSAGGFLLPEPTEAAERFAACLQGVGLVERLAYHVLDGVAGTSGGAVFSTGAASRSDVWMQCRADVTGRVLHRPACPESAFGSAVLAAAGTCCDDLYAAIEQMVRIQATFQPNPEHAEQYGRLFARFCEELDNRGYR